MAGIREQKRPEGVGVVLAACGPQHRKGDRQTPCKPLHGAITAGGGSNPPPGPIYTLTF